MYIQELSTESSTVHPAWWWIDGDVPEDNFLHKWKEFKNSITKKKDNFVSNEDEYGNYTYSRFLLNNGINYLIGYFNRLSPFSFYESFSKNELL